MAISDWIPEVWAARYTRALRNELVWGNFVDTSHQPEIVNYGDTIHIPTWNKKVTVSDYVIGTALSDPETADGGDIEMNIDKQKAWNLQVYDINQVQSRPNIMDRFMNQAAFDSASQIDTDIKAEFVKNYDASREEEVSGTLEADEFGKAFITAIIKTKRLMTEAHIPLDGR